MKIPRFTLFHSGRRPASASGRAAAMPKALSRLVREKERQPGAQTVGIWDLGAWVGGLPKIVEALNTAQPGIVIFEIQAAIPAGLVSRRQRIASWAEERLARPLGESQRAELTDAIIDVEFFPLAQGVRRDLGIDYLVGLTPSAIAGEVDDEEGHVVHSDFFSSVDDEDTTVLVSTVGLREYAAKAARRFECGVGFVFLASLLVAMNKGRLEFHDDTRGCLFDYNFERSGIVKVLEKPGICAECTKSMKPRLRRMAQALLQALAAYPRPSDVAGP